VELLTAARWGGRRHFDIYFRTIATAARSREATEDKQENAAEEQSSHDDAEDSRGAAGIVCHLISPPIHSALPSIQISIGSIVSDIFKRTSEICQLILAERNTSKMLVGKIGGNPCIWLFALFSLSF
jgi:hypothetical protein